MLLSLTSYNLIFIWPHKVQLIQKSWLPNTTFIIKETYHTDQNADTKETLALLKRVIQKLETWRPLKVILFGNKVRYRLLEHHVQLNPTEFLALAEHQFRQILGHKAFEWQYFSQRVRPERNNITVALESSWLGNIRSFLTESGIKSFSIQPAATWLFNHYRKQLDADQWFFLQTGTDLFTFKLHQYEIDHFKHDTLKPSLTVEQMIRREILMIGDDPELATFNIYGLDDLLKNKSTAKSLSAPTEHLASQEAS